MAKLLTLFILFFGLQNNTYADIANNDSSDAIEAELEEGEKESTDKVEEEKPKEKGSIFGQLFGNKPRFGGSFSEALDSDLFGPNRISAVAGALADISTSIENNDPAYIELYNDVKSGDYLSETAKTAGLIATGVIVIKQVFKRTPVGGVLASGVVVAPGAYADFTSVYIDNPHMLIESQNLDDVINSLSDERVMNKAIEIIDYALKAL